MCANIKTSCFGTGAKMKQVPIWGFRYETWFWNWAPSLKTWWMANSSHAQFRHWSIQFQHCMPQIGMVLIWVLGCSSSGTGCPVPKLGRCQNEGEHIYKVYCFICTLGIVPTCKVYIDYINHQVRQMINSSCPPEWLEAKTGLFLK